MYSTDSVKFDLNVAMVKTGPAQQNPALRWVKAGPARLLWLHRFMGCNNLITFLRPGISLPSVAATPAGAETGAYGQSGSPPAGPAFTLLGRAEAGRAGFYP